jgi:hypothetical protein
MVLRISVDDPMETTNTYWRSRVVAGSLARLTGYVRRKLARLLERTGWFGSRWSGSSISKADDDFKAATPEALFAWYASGRGASSGVERVASGDSARDVK